MEVDRLIVGRIDLQDLPLSIEQARGYASCSTRRGLHAAGQIIAPAARAAIFMLPLVGARRFAAPRRRSPSNPCSVFRPTGEKRCARMRETGLRLPLPRGRRVTISCDSCRLTCRLVALASCSRGARRETSVRHRRNRPGRAADSNTKTFSHLIFPRQRPRNQEPISWAARLPGPSPHASPRMAGRPPHAAAGPVVPAQSFWHTPISASSDGARRGRAPCRGAHFDVSASWAWSRGGPRHGARRRHALTRISVGRPRVSGLKRSMT